MKHLSAGVYYVCAFLAGVLRALTALGVLIIEFFWPLFWTGVLLGLFVLLFSFSVAENREWEAFRVQHACKVTQKMKGDVNVGIGTTVGGNGQVGVGPVTTVSPDKTGWLCDDGVTYWR